MHRQTRPGALHAREGDILLVSHEIKIAAFIVVGLTHIPVFCRILESLVKQNIITRLVYRVCRTGRDDFEYVTER